MRDVKRMALDSPMMFPVRDHYSSHGTCHRSPVKVKRLDGESLIVSSPSEVVTKISGDILSTSRNEKRRKEMIDINKRKQVEEGFITREREREDDDHESSRANNEETEGVNELELSCENELWLIDLLHCRPT